MFQPLFRLSDTALGVLFQFLKKFLTVVCKMFEVDQLNEVIQRLPSSLLLSRRIMGWRTDPFKKYVCCPKCHCLYDLDKCSLIRNSLLESKKCDYVAFPNHPQKHRRKLCSEVLMKHVCSPSGKILLHPRSLFCYHSIIDSLQELLKRLSLITKCELWRNRKVFPGTYTDIYDGKVWKEFLNPNNKPFLSLPFNFAFNLNIDWFQPFKYTNHSEGVMYSTILNLTRCDRYQKEKVILLGVIPGPNEPKKNINPYLEPLVNELQELWKGVLMKSSKELSVIVCGALLCIGCDVLAAKKTCGFLSCNAVYGCSKCLVRFPTKAFGKKSDYSNFNPKEWKKRDGKDHNYIATEYKNCVTKVERKVIERQFGIRYSVLSELLYIDLPRMCIVDPMHNLFLGTAKLILELWKEGKIIDNKKAETI